MREQELLRPSVLASGTGIEEPMRGIGLFEAVNTISCSVLNT